MPGAICALGETRTARLSPLPLKTACSLPPPPERQEAMIPKKRRGKSWLRGFRRRLANCFITLLKTIRLAQHGRRHRMAAHNEATPRPCRRRSGCQRPKRHSPTVGLLQPA